MAEVRIDDIRRQLQDISVKSKLNAPEEKAGENFSNFLKDAIDNVNNDQVKAEHSIQDFMTGKETSLHNTLISLEKADVSFKMMMQVRGKLMEAYQQIMRTSV